MKFHGAFTALVTPFDNGEVDYLSLARLVDQQLEGGIQGFIVCGTTAESPTLTEEEKLKVLQFVCEKTAGRVPVVFGSGSNCTQTTIELSRKACEFPIDGLLCVVPYYNKPPQEGMVAHFLKLADSVNKPVLLYNVPGRTVVGLSPQSIVTLAKHPNIAGIKEADGDLNKFDQYKDLVPQDFALLSGDDESCVNFCLRGGHGVISVCSHIAPQLMVDFIARARSGDTAVKGEFAKQIPWIQSLYLTANPIPVKAALAKKGLIAKKEVRLPLVPMSTDLEAQMMTSLESGQELL